MSNLKQAEIQLQIAQIIDKSRHQEECFLINSKIAASEIIQFLLNMELIEGFHHEKGFNLEN